MRRMNLPPRYNTGNRSANLKRGEDVYSEENFGKRCTNSEDRPTAQLYLSLER